MLLDSILFAVGIAFLVTGAWMLVTGGSKVAALLGVAPVVIGLTIVAFGTSAPELFVCLVAALRGSNELMLGNVVGSNVANIGLILGLATLIMPVGIDRHIIRLEIPLLLLATVLFGAMCWNLELGQWEGAVLLLLFCVFMVLTLRSAGSGGGRKLPAAELAVSRTRSRDIAVNLGLVTIGIVGLTAGGHLIVDSSVRIAIRLGASEALIGLTLVAVGTSLPELATTVTASIRREGGIALGNVVGSNLFNLLAVGGLVAVIKPVTAESSLRTHQIPGMLLPTLLLPLLCLGRERVSRFWGAVLLLIYGAVMAWWLRSGI